MTSRLFIRAGLAGALVLSSLGLAACGKQGSLDRPGSPLFGAPRSEHRAMRDAAGRANQEKDADTSATSQTNGDYTYGGDRAKDPALLPPRTDPPVGINNNGLSGGGANGVLPDPYADPNRSPR